ncbi:tape measure protein [Oryzicola mucosus]|uniref:Lysozyme n=1 Tax=Oryzicola mucosus TaxID=2767425 RepID=A0A8J6U922_9HYPH|nr:tape measure protein [Oryzicola mucosus]MBD0416502.1 tape measure protein [Oryzicola mucosus]
MGVTVEELRATLRLELKPYERELQKLQGVNSKSARQVEATWRATNQRLNSVGKSMARSLVVPLTGVAAAMSVREVLNYADAWTGAKNSLAVAGVTGTKQADILDRLYQSAQKNAAPISALAGLYGKAAQASDNLQASQSDLLKFSDGVATSLRVEGKSAAQASGALTQLGQLLGQARVQAEEFNSVNEGARPILMAVAAGLDAAGGSVSKLKELVNDGEVSGKQFFQAFLRGLPVVEKMAANATQTIDQGMTKVANALTKYIGQTDSALGASQRLVAGLNLLADNFDEVADVTLIVAGIIAGALVGRSIASMISSLGLGTAAILRFTKAMIAARTVAQTATAIGGLSAAAGPIGIVLGTVAAGAAMYFGSEALEAADRTERLTTEMKDLGLLSEETSPKIDGVTKSLEDLAADELRKKLKDINDELDRMNDRSWTNVFTGGIETLADAETRIGSTLLPQSRASAADKDAARRLRDLIKAAKEGSLTSEEVRAKLDEIAKIEVSDRMEGLFGVLRKVLPYMEGLRKHAEGTANALKTVGSIRVNDDERGRFLADRRALAEDQRKTKEFLDQRDADAMRTDLQRDIDTRTKAILKAADDIGVNLTEAAARIQAQGEIAAEAQVKATTAAVGSASDIIKKFEGFRENPYWDVNAYRVGYGSDTITLADGTVQKVVQGISVSVNDANRDLVRRIGEFQDGIRAKIGGGTFDAMSDNQQAALTSIAYNYGSLPDRIVAAIRTGSSEQVYAAIKGLGSDNKGVNRDRRTQEAELYLSGASPMAQDSVARRESFQQSLEEQKQYIASLQAETAIRTTLNPLINDYGQAMSTVEAAQYLLTTAQREGTAAGRELKDVQQLLYGDLSKLSAEARSQAEAMRTLAQKTGEAEAAGVQLAESQGKLQESLKQSSQFGKDILGGFISDLKAGKKASEALADALEKVADRLLDVALNSIFDGSVAGSGGGLLGGLFKWLFARDGGTVRKGDERAGGAPARRMKGGGRVRGPGGPTGDKILTLLSDGEHVTRAAMAKKYAPLLDAINNGTLPDSLIPKMRAGGWAGVRAPSIPSLPARSGRFGEVLRIELQDDTGRMADIADRRIQTASGPLVEFSVVQSTKVGRKALPNQLQNHQKRGTM